MGREQIIPRSIEFCTLNKAVSSFAVAREAEWLQIGLCTPLPTTHYQPLSAAVVDEVSLYAITHPWSAALLLLLALCCSLLSPCSAPLERFTAWLPPSSSSSPCSLPPP